MARSKTDLPRMQTPARSRAPLRRGINIVSQVVGRKEKSDQPDQLKPMMRQYELVERVRALDMDEVKRSIAAAQPPASSQASTGGA